MTPITLRSPAKVNLFLSVGPPDAAGYHPLRSVMQAVGLFDEIQIVPADHDTLECNWPGLPAENTLTKTLRLIREQVPLPPVHIRLMKSIPAESGLGGGSGNAAALIRWAKSAVAHRIDDHFFYDVARAVGADVPFFLVGGRARAEGYGERLTPLPDADPAWLVIVRPEVGVSTASAYRALDAAPREWRNWPELTAPVPTWLYNDFERVAPCLCGEVAERLQLAGAEGALLSGSGSAVFGWCSDPKQAEAVAERAREERLGQVWVAPTLSREESLA
jgi:4-diphosphocytidyl-2-C-methyl-D-erythritol kinase